MTHAYRTPVGHRRLRTVVVAAGLAAGLVLAAPPIPRGGATAAASGPCPTRVDASEFASPTELRRLSARVAGFGTRFTASDEHERLLSWMKAKLDDIPGMRVRQESYGLNRWLPTPRAAFQPGRDLGRAGTLALVDRGRTRTLPTAGALVNTRPTGGRGVTAPLVHVPADQPLSRDRVAGRIVIRDVPSSPIPYAALAAVSHYLSPDLVREVSSTYDRPYLATDGPLAADLGAAARAGATGYIAAWNVPAEQVRGYFDPHTGTLEPIPGIWVGVDEAVRLKKAAARGGRARLGVLAEVTRARTRQLFATLPGASSERNVLVTNTDGNTWVQENGNAALLALARHFASLPRACRPKTLEFAFTSGHLHRSREGSEMYAERLDEDWEDQDVGFVLVVEHLGTREILPVDRRNGPGERLKFTGRGEPYAFFAPTESPALSTAMVRAVTGRHLSRTAVLRGQDVPDSVRVPAQCSFGGIGTSFHSRLIPTIGGISGPWSLWAPGFGRRAVDPARMRQQALAIGDAVISLGGLSRSSIAGLYPAERAARAAGVPTCDLSHPQENGPTAP